MIDCWWNGEPAVGERIVVRVPEWRAGDPPLAWWRDLVGIELPAVRVAYDGHQFILDDRDDYAIAKIVDGHGSPRFGHRELPLRSPIVEVLG